MTRKTLAYIGRCVVCGSGGPVYRIEKQGGNWSHPEIYTVRLLLRDERRSECFAYVCDREECYNLALLNNTFYWG